ncbi:hypothetical protein CLIB1444_01S16754 [[Candida] jaroonii]|uniref:Uncharacterized protein n=1 Tax=[Candida] jaroonii TaxID=467808 RepID=A0ACA9Y1Q7_9ASCO|nr:hypothetical protein CLIB1444_01S16754 [[Candida] jaroonii]
MSFKNSFFDVNILDDALSSPNIELTVPLPFDEPHFDFKDNEPEIRNWKILLNFIEFVTGIKVNDIYSNNEYYFNVNKMNPNFNKRLDKFLDGKLQNDEKLDQIIHDLINKEFNMNLISSKDLPVRFKQVKEFMINYYKQQNGKNYPTFQSTNFVRICYVTVMKLLQKMFPDGIYCNKQQFTDLYQQYLDDPMSIVYLPCHKSHVDYIIMHILTVRFQLATPTVIAGENLNVAIFGTILKKLGAIFIKRSFNNEIYTERNLQHLLEYLIENKIDLELFIEGTRSRDGKLLLPKYGILKMFQNIYTDTGNDCLIQPVSISYERIYEADGYLKELIGKDKKQESFVSIINNGVKNLFGREEEFSIDRIIKKNKPYDNMNRDLKGKIYIQLGETFKLSSVKNLKQLSFKTLHTINQLNYLMEISIIGAVLQWYLYKHDVKTIDIEGLKPWWDFVLTMLEYEVKNDVNASMIKYLESLDMEGYKYLLKYQIIKFFKYIKVEGDTIVIDKSLELLYYKNLTIHLLITKSIFGLIINTTPSRHWLKSFNLLKNLLKSEFLFDHNENPNDEYENIIEKFKADGKLSNDLEVLDAQYFQDLALIVTPFIKSYMICVENVQSIMSQYYSTHKPISQELLLTNNLMDFPNTKTLLKLIQTSNPDADFESINKQYLLSELYYLNYLGLIKIFKNNAKTIAYVKIEREEDLKVLGDFLKNFFVRTEVSVPYAAKLINREIKL